MCFHTTAHAQGRHTHGRNCGTMDYLEQQIQKDPARGLRLQAIDRQAKRFIQQPKSLLAGVITIPVVVHIVYDDPSEDITDAQVQSQIDVLNEDFRRANTDAANTPADFTGVAADIEIEFCLATVDPQGAATSGITRTVTTTTPFLVRDNVKFTASGGIDAWPTGDYLNIWICEIDGGTLGYAQFPGGPAATDGVVIDYRYMGRGGSAQVPYNLGRTATHEVGHWLNMRHIWGDGDCSVDDFVADTPNAGSPNYTGSPCTYPGPNTCIDAVGDLPDMFQNYMDYSDDACMNLFTQGQKTRMRALFEPEGARVSLLTSNGCGLPATCDDGIQNGDETGVDCGGSNCGPCPCYASALTLTITLDNYPGETSWEVKDASNNNVVASGGPYGAQPAGSTVVENINLAAGDYTFTIFDSFGDGICCAQGNGSYTLSDGANTIASGGGFGSSESTPFCTESACPDADSDGVCDADDNCPNDANAGQADADGDGFGDACDNCPDDPKKVEPGACGCGIADTDSDNDGAADCIDNCPTDPNKVDPGICGCGTADDDTDGDGTADCLDGCPTDPNKVDPGICGCGTADDDTDGDGTADCLDNCPTDPNKVDPGICGCGTADDDTDGDGTADCIDNCPTDPNKVDPGICGCGTADDDTDGDGTADCLDGCPTDPNKVDPGICGCGIADDDTDGDGTADCLDGCPTDPNKVDPGICGCGTADDDTDGDGTADCLDGCPTDPNKVDPGICGCGTADDDTDGDGTAEGRDGGVSDPNKVVAGLRGCGIADDDTEGDGRV
ncbi:MAG: zinc metalloprotease [Phaeodactylibacter sp.]|nr:zinc metalloprotease [Phaeodactylibacter sp.]